MHPPAKHVAVELLERGDDETHLGDRADSQIPAAPVCRAPFRLDFRPHKTFVRQHQPALARFGQHARFRLVVRNEMLSPDARILFVRHQRHHHPAPEFFPRQRRRGAQDGCRAAFHVVAPRPYTRPSRTAGSKGGMVIPAVETVSRCAQNTRQGAPAVPTSPMAFARPGAASSIQLRMPCFAIHSQATRAMAASPVPSAGASDGFTDGVAISLSNTSSTAAVSSAACPIVPVPAFPTLAQVRTPNDLYAGSDLRPAPRPFFP